MAVHLDPVGRQMPARSTLFKIERSIWASTVLSQADPLPQISNEVRDVHFGVLRCSPATVRSGGGSRRQARAELRVTGRWRPPPLPRSDHGRQQLLALPVEVDQRHRSATAGGQRRLHAPDVMRARSLCNTARQPVLLPTGPGAGPRPAFNNSRRSDMLNTLASDQARDASRR